MWSNRRDMPEISGRRKPLATIWPVRGGAKRHAMTDWSRETSGRVADVSVEFEDSKWPKKLNHRLFLRGLAGSTLTIASCWRFRWLSLDTFSSRTRVF